MSNYVLDDLDRTRFVWPEPLLIDLATSVYTEQVGLPERVAVARRHVRFLRELVEGEQRQSAFLRLELLAAATAAGIRRDRMEAADRAVFEELGKLVAARFRNSARLQAFFKKRFEDAAARLPAPTEPRVETQKVERLPQKKDRVPRFLSRREPVADGALRKYLVNG